MGVPWRTIAGVIACVLVIVAIQFWLPDSVTVGPVWLIPALELLGIPIALAVFKNAGWSGRSLTRVVDAFLVLLVAASVMNAVLLLVSLLEGARETGQYLLFAGFAVLIANVLSFGLVYWWIDGGGPIARARGTVTDPEIAMAKVFASEMCQMVTDEAIPCLHRPRKLPVSMAK